MAVHAGLHAFGADSAKEELPQPTRYRGILDVWS